MALDSRFPSAGRAAIVSLFLACFVATGASAQSAPRFPAEPVVSVQTAPAQEPKAEARSPAKPAAARKAGAPKAPKARAQKG